MLGEQHDLFHEFPEYRERIVALRATDAQFAELCDEYHRLDAEVLRIETSGQNTSDTYLEELKIKRVHLKDRLYAMLRG